LNFRAHAYYHPSHEHSVINSDEPFIMPEYSPTHHPQYGKIKDNRLDKGDFVFALKMPSKPKPPAGVQSSGVRELRKKASMKF
jgi:hypothetical protein